MKTKYEEVVKLFDSYLKSQKPIDKDFIINAVEDILNTDKTSYLVNDICFDISRNNIAGASYNYKVKKLNFNEWIFDENKELEQLEYLLANNICILQYILHECSHIAQVDTLLNSDNIESKVLKYSNMGFEVIREEMRKDLEGIESDDELFNILKNNYDMNYLIGIHNFDVLVRDGKIYDLSPAERMAEIRSHKIVSNILASSKNAKDIEIEKKTVDNILNQKYVENYQRSHGKLISPFERYKKIIDTTGINDIEINYQEVMNSNLDINDRLYYGLPINNEEYKRIKRLAK